MAKKICINFDRTIASLAKDNTVKGAELVADADNALAALKKKGWTIILKTALPVDEVKEWLKEKGLAYDHINEKEEDAELYVDTKNVRYSGSWSSVIWDIAYFKESSADKKDVVKEMTDRLEEGNIWKRGQEKRTKAGKHCGDNCIG